MTNNIKQSLDLEITEWKNNAKAALTLSFDDCYKQTFLLCAPILARLNISSTWNIATKYVNGTLGDIEVVSWSDLKDIALNMDVEIASHSVSHKSVNPSFLHYAHRAINYFRYDNHKATCLREIAEVGLPVIIKRTRFREGGDSSFNPEDEIVASKKAIELEIPSQETLSYVYPGGAHNDNYKHKVSAAGYTSARSSLRGYNQYSSLDLMALKCLVWTRYTTLKDANKWLDKAIKKHAWLIENYHLVSDSNPSGYRWFTSVKDFRDHVSHLSTFYLGSSNQIWVATQKDITSYIRQRQMTEIDVTEQDNGQWMVRLKGEGGCMSDQILTLKATISPHCRNPIVNWNGKSVTVYREGTSFFFNVLPSQEQITIMSGN